MKKKYIEREENFFRFRNKKDNKVYYDSIPVGLINKASFLKDKKRICAYAYNWHFEVIEGVKRVVYSFNACEQFVFERVYTLNGTVNDELLRLLEKTESIRLCDGEIDFDRVLMRNFNFAIEKNRKGNLYKMKRFCLVPDSYRENLGAFYDIDEIFWKLAQKHEKTELLPEDIQFSPIVPEVPLSRRRYEDTSYNEENIIIRALEDPEMMRDSPMLDYIPAEKLTCENVRYFPSEDKYFLSVEVQVALGDIYNDDLMEVESDREPTVPILWRGNKHYYHTELEVNDDFYSMLQEIGATDEYGWLNFDSDELYVERFEIILRKCEDKYYFNGLRIAEDEEQH
ncbi:hypothetical protein [Sellimonas intestinalis]|uniref:hypothetical protein n=1 Tax=Sellimonas intestinalis TaxID=1653434 RepID=UPI0015ECA027|nr:hypothetical protein [Sellimonas intestinalis]MBA2213618.1 hypothetical protein [Sellimonas intestinalis]